MDQETLSQLFPEEVDNYVDSQLAKLQDSNTPLSDRLFYGEVAAKLLLKSGYNSEAAEIYDEMSTLAPQPRFSQAADSARGVAEASDIYFGTQQKFQNAQTTMLTLLLCSQVIYDWTMQGEAYKESWVGTVENYWLPEWSTTHYFERTKPLLIEFLKKWEYLAGTGDFSSTLDIFAEIAKGNNDAAEGCKIFRAMIFDPGNGQHNLGYTHYYAVQSFIDSEKIKDPQQKSKEILENTNRWLLTNGEAYGAAYAIGDLFKDDPNYSELANQVMRHAESQPAFDTICHIVNPENPLMLVAGLGAARGMFALGRMAKLGLMGEASLPRYAWALAGSLGFHLVAIGVVGEMGWVDTKPASAKKKDEPVSVDLKPDEPEQKKDKSQKPDETRPKETKRPKVPPPGVKPPDAEHRTSPVYQTPDQLRQGVRGAIGDIDGSGDETETDLVERAKKKAREFPNDQAVPPTAVELKEPKYLKNIREATPINPPKLRSQAQLIEEAQAALMEYEHSGKVNFEYGSFFVNSEMILEPSENQATIGPIVIAALATLFKDLKTLADAEKTYTDKLEALRGVLLKKYLKYYEIEKYNLTDLLQGLGGNCHAETKLVIAAMSAVNLELSADQVLGVQVFRGGPKGAGHAQPVIYDKKKGTVTEIISGRIINEVRAPIYAPLVLFHAWLRGQGIEPSVSIDQLLIVGRNSDYGMNFNNSDSGSQWDRSNADLSFEGGENNYSDGPVPEYAVRSYSALHDGSTNEISSDIAGSGGTISSVTQFISVVNLPKAEQEQYLNDNSLFTMSYVDGGRTVIFDKPYHLQYSQSLKSDYERALFLQELASQSVASKLQDPNLNRALTILKKPDVFESYNEEEIKNAQDSLSDLFSTISSSKMAIGNAFFDLREQSEMMAFDQSYVQRLIAMNSILAEYKQAIEDFGTRVKKYPIDYLLWLDTLTPEQHQLFFDFMDTVDYQHVAFKTDWLNLDEPFKLALQKPELIGAYGTSIDLSSEDYIVVSFVDDSTIPIPDNIGHGNSDRHVDGGKESLPVDDRNTMHAAEVIPKNFISARFMIELIQKFNPSRKYPVAILTQWTPTFSHAFVSLNKDGKYDEFFLELYPIISRYLQKKTASTRMVPNPLYSEADGSFSKEMEHMGNMGGDGFDSMLRHTTPETVPEDLVPILQAIKKRQEQKKAAAELAQTAPSEQ